MNNFLRIPAYILHPLLIPLIGTALYFFITPRYVETELIEAKILAVAIITFLIPIITFFLLKNLSIINTIHLEETRERKVPLMIQCMLLLLIVKMVFNPYDSAEMYYFFVGILFSTIAALLLVIFKFKVSLHQMGISGLTMFLLALSIHFEVNLLLWIGFLFFANGWVATSRLHTASHTYPEIITGFFIGFLPQLILINFWL